MPEVVSAVASVADSVQEGSEDPSLLGTELVDVTAGCVDEGGMKAGLFPGGTVHVDDDVVVGLCVSVSAGVSVLFGANSELVLAAGEADDISLDMLWIVDAVPPTAGGTSVELTCVTGAAVLFSSRAVVDTDVDADVDLDVNVDVDDPERSPVDVASGNTEDDSVTGSACGDPVKIGRVPVSLGSGELLGGGVKLEIAVGAADSVPESMSCVVEEIPVSAGGVVDT